MDVSQPIGQVVVTFQIGDIVHEQDAHCPSVVGGGKGAEAFLASGVPDLQFNGHTVQINELLFEIDAYNSNNIFLLYP